VIDVNIKYVGDNNFIDTLNFFLDRFDDESRDRISKKIKMIKQKITEHKDMINKLRDAQRVRNVIHK